MIAQPQSRQPGAGDPGPADDRVRAVNAAPLVADGRYVLYWMIAARRAQANFALDRALVHARALGRPLLVFEPLRAGYPWASARLHQFVLDGMQDNARAFDRPGVRYFAYVEPAPGDGRGLLEALAADAAVVVTDDFPALLPAAHGRRGAGARLPVRLEAVDGNGLLPMRAAGRAWPTALAMRRQVQHTLAAHLAIAPDRDPFARPVPGRRPGLPEGVGRRWPDVARGAIAAAGSTPCRSTQDVAPTELRGGSVAGRARLAAFVGDGLAGYLSGARDAARDAGSGLSPYLHFGHVSAHEVFAAVMHQEGWLGLLPRRGTGARAGWWGVSPAAEAFLDQLVTWRELGFNMCAHRPDYDAFGSLPAWALDTLRRHAGDHREHVYTAGGVGRGGAPTTRCGTPPSVSSCARDASTPTCACCGARRSCSGRRPPRTRWRR